MINSQQPNPQLVLRLHQ